ncbi:elongation factor 1-beta 2-like [Hibiscus syriacus]|uniref:Elongation factor 1-beta 2-like n=1 Tax=Hibiscus syriacus TaxID=106335 RepID=A0A6A3D855_HIBSY|nr:elongation factor 1-beta 2-like [Hibiscus syriacus]
MHGDLSHATHGPCKAPKQSSWNHNVGRWACMATYKVAGSAWRPCRSLGVHGDLCWGCWGRALHMQMSIISVQLAGKPWRRSGSSGRHGDLRQTVDFTLFQQIIWGVHYLVGAGILAIPAVTQESGFLASPVACNQPFQVATGLLIAEVNVNRSVNWVLVVFLWYPWPGELLDQLEFKLLARSSDILTNYLGIPLYEPEFKWGSATLFSLVFGGLCYFGRLVLFRLFIFLERFVGAVNGVLVLGIIASCDRDWDALLKANFAAVPMSIPITALSFVYQNVVPVLCTNLEGDMSKDCYCSRNSNTTWFISCVEWCYSRINSNLDMSSGQMIDPLKQLRSSNGSVAPIIEVFSLLAIATSYIGFVLGLPDFLAALLKLPASENKPQPSLDLGSTSRTCFARPGDIF